MFFWHSWCAAKSYVCLQCSNYEGVVSRSTAFQRQLLSGSRSLVSAAHRGPQRFVQAGFQTGEGEGVGPGLPGDDVCQRCVVNTREFFDCSQRSIAYDQLQLFDEQSGAFTNRISRGVVRPVPAQVGWSWSRFAWHRRRLNNRRTEQLSFDSLLEGFCHTPSPYLSVVTDSRGKTENRMATRIERYTPRDNTGLWKSISEFVRCVVSETEPYSAYDAGSLLSSITKFVTWTYEHGEVLDRVVIFDLWKIEYTLPTDAVAWPQRREETGDHNSFVSQRYLSAQHSPGLA